ncbi:MAG TPA: oligopeptide ABC transporter permease OppB [Dongiaceae bacterium]|nr:oligopeptide ABC transporter permease OppB [Dongiaceae bacterium]
MLRFAAKRLIGAIPTLFLIVTFSFFLMRIAPGGPFDRERIVPPEIEARLIHAYHLDDPLWKQYLRYLGDLVQGDFGPSLKYKDFTVTELIAEGFPVSMRLGGLAVLIALLVGVSTGTIAALRQNSGTDYTAMGVAMTGIIVPNFVMAPLLTLVFGLWLSWLPVGGWGGPIYMILPVIALSLYQIGFIARLTRGSMIEVLRTNYVRTARAKGLPERVAITRHALKAAMLPVVSYLGPAIINTITGSVIIEQIFGIPGIGRYFVQAALNRDYTLVMGVTVFYGVLIILANLAVDLIYGLLDPRIRYD